MRDGDQASNTPIRAMCQRSARKDTYTSCEMVSGHLVLLTAVLDGAHAHDTRRHAVAYHHKRAQKEVLDSHPPSSTLRAMRDGGTPEYVGESCTRRLHAIQPPQTLCSAPCGGQSIRSMVLDGSSPSNTKFGCDTKP